MHPTTPRSRAHAEPVRIRDRVRRGRAHRQAQAQAHPDARQLPRRDRGELAVGVTEYNPTFLRKDKVYPPFELWRKVFDRWNPSHYRLILDWSILEPRRDETPSSSRRRAACGRSALPRLHRPARPAEGDRRAPAGRRLRGPGRAPRHAALGRAEALGVRARPAPSPARARRRRRAARRMRRSSAACSPPPAPRAPSCATGAPGTSPTSPRSSPHSARPAGATSRASPPRSTR